jgi:hypothetical protein
MTTDNVNILFTTTADSLVPGDQIIVDDELIIVHSVDHDREDIDEVLVKGENLTDPDNNELPLYADDEYAVWGI